jgi:hypothetical protein
MGRPTATTCGGYYDGDEYGYWCEREPGHEPPHRETRDYRTDDAGFRFRQVTEWSGLEYEA